jgi:predicted nuclease of predicted toxin-antitoxin system
VRFLIDAQLPPALTKLLRLLGHHADHVVDLGLESASDAEIWRFASENGAIIVTKDEDFRALRILREDGPAIVWIRIGNTTTPALISSLSTTWAEIVEALERGEPIVEVT